MTAFRRSLHRHRALAAWLVAAALVMKLLVPAGFMPMLSGAGLSLTLCSGYAQPPAAAGAHGMGAHYGAGMDHGAGHDKGEHGGKAEMPCAFSGLANPSLAAVDPVLLVAAIAFIIETVFRAGVAVRPRRPAYLRPPLRGPPAVI